MQPPTIEPQLDQTVQIRPRTFPGVNKPGGTGIITAIHRDEKSGDPIQVDVKYVLGGKESNIEMTYVMAEETVEGRRRGTRERKQDVKMNIGEETPKKKRVALKDIDGNSKKLKTDELKKQGTCGELPAGCEMDGEWMFIQSGKLSDYTSYFTKGTVVQFWWNDDKGWLQATLLKDIKRTLSRGMIKWNVEMKFDVDGETLKYCFLPKDKRWKVKIEDDGDSDESMTLKEVEAEKKAKVKRGTSAKKTKPQAAKGPAKKKGKSSKKKEALFTIAIDSDAGDESNHKSASQMNNTEAVPKVTPVGKKDSTKGSHKKPEPVDLGLLDKKKTNATKSANVGQKKDGHTNTSKQTDLRSSAKKSVKTSSKEGDAIIVQKTNQVGVTFQAKNHFSKPAPSKLFGQKKQDTVPASSFHRSNKKCTANSNPFTLTQMPAGSTNTTSFSLSAKVQSSIREVSSKTIKRSKENEASSSAKTAGPKTTGAMTVMTGIGRSTTSTKGSSASNRLKNNAKAQYEKNYRHACDWMNSLKEKTPDEAKDSFSTSSEENETERDQDRKEVFRNGFVEVFFKPAHNDMDIATFLKKLNSHVIFMNHDQFTLPEVTRYLQHTVEEGKITIDWKDGLGVIYDCS